ncbi:MAG: hypothetical protein FWH14_01190 [Oscillospiraceae bacterium]|nr:hypothetical protein [Oscillospiraceae bacterium]
MKFKVISLFIMVVLSLSMLSACGKAGTGTDASEDGSRDTSGSGSVSEGESTTDLKLNEDLLADFGLTFSEIEEKRGKLTEYSGVRYSGGKHFVSESNDQIQYAWGHDSYNDDGIVYPEIGCRLIETSVKILFSRVNENSNSNEIENAFDVEHIHNRDTKEALGLYTASFRYNEMIIFIYTESDDVITPDSFVNIHFYDDFAEFL